MREAAPPGPSPITYNPSPLSIATWKYDKDWVYSVTYDEALADLSRLVIPTHQNLGIPGHVEVVSGQIGQIRNCGASSFNGFRHMDTGELRELVSIGWGVGCHSWSHGMVMDDPDRELREAKETIESAIGRPVTVYTAPGNNDNLTPEVIDKIREYGYLAGMSITDDINRSDPDDLMWINRVPIHERYWGVFDSAFDPHKRIRQAQDHSAWIVDYMHCPLEKPVHDYKDCSAAHHRERLEAVLSAGGANCWYANPDDVIDYRYMRRHASLEATGNGDYLVRVQELPDQISLRELTFSITGFSTPEALTVQVDGVVCQASPVRPGVVSFTAPVRDGSVISVQPKHLRRNTT